MTGTAARLPRPGPGQARQERLPAPRPRRRATRRRSPATTPATARCSRSTSGSATRSARRRYGMSANSADRALRRASWSRRAARRSVTRRELLADDGTRITVRAPWAGEGVRDFGFVRFEPGDVFTEHYWRDRWYAVKEVRTGDGALKGWYCDITRPAVLDGGELVVEDLDLDLWVLGGRHGRTAAGRGRVRGERPRRPRPGRRRAGGGRPRRARSPRPPGQVDRLPRSDRSLGELLAVADGSYGPPTRGPQKRQL